MDDQMYLEPGFDPASLTMPRLRSILVAHGVDYPASSKKPQLIDIFNENVLPQARRLRAASARVKRTSRGIVDMPSQESSVAGEDAEEPAPSLRPTPRSTRRSTRSRTEEPDEVEPTPRSTRHSTAPPERYTPARRASSKHLRDVEVETVDEEVEPERKRPNSRRSGFGVTPRPTREDKRSPFSDQNVFQSGSSPPAPERRRTTFGRSRSGERQRSRDGRRKTDEVRSAREQVGNAVVPSRKTFEMPVARVPKREPVSDALEPTEEFTPDEQQELVNAQTACELVPARRKVKPAASTTAKMGPAALLTALLAGFATLYRQEKLKVGYCEVGSPSTEIAGTQIPEWADVARPQCEPCPPHAYCYENFRTECETGFVLTPHPLSVNGLVPLPPSCEPDSQRTRKVQAVKQVAVEKLREQNAKFECGEANKPELQEAELKTVIASKRRKGMSNEEFEDLWNSALPELQNADEVETGAGGTLRSESLARVPFTCALRRSLRETLKRYLWQIVVVVLLTSSGAYGRHKYIDSGVTEAKAKELAKVALQILARQAAIRASDPSGEEDAYISMAQLRDDLLQHEFSLSKRDKLWSRVKEKVESNSNVRPMVREGRTGDVGRVWEWIGAVNAIEDTPGSRRSISWSPGDGLAGDKLIEPGKDEKEARIVKWEEGGGQYY